VHLIRRNDLRDARLGAGFPDDLTNPEGILVALPEKIG
jgi:hypothetical protein